MRDPQAPRWIRTVWGVGYRSSHEGCDLGAAGSGLPASDVNNLPRPCAVSR
jgi:hypothetical protein